MKIETLNIDQIKPYSLNAKLHPEEQILGLMQSLKDFKVTQPAVVDKNNVLIIGHGRIEAAKRLGFKNFPVILRSDLSEKDAHALRLLDNKSSEGEWDIEKLKIQFEGSPIEFEKYNVSFDFSSHPEDSNFDPEIGIAFGDSTGNKKVVLMYSEDEYDLVIKILDAIVEQKDFKNYSEVVKELI